MTTLFAGILMLGVLVFVHELGHFCIAKLSGVKVLKFSLGFGPKLLSKRWGETEYLISAIPLGGYVQMLGEGAGDEEEELTPEEKARSFADKPLSRRIAIVAAGPAMNLILPFLLLPVSFLIGVNLPAFFDRPPCIGYVVPDSEGATAGVVSGDCIQSVNGDEVSTWTETNQALVSHVGAPIVLKVQRQGQPIELTLNFTGDDLENLQLRNLGLHPQQEAIVGAVSPGMPAEAAGMRAGDRILAIGGQPISSWYDLKSAVMASQGAAQDYQVERQGETLEFSIQPEQHEENGSGYFIGIAPLQETSFKRFGFFAAVREGAKQAVDIIQLTLVFIQKLFAGHVSAKNIGGPISVFQMAGQAAQTDTATVFTILAFLSIQLGILNLLPIPILDGGHLFFYAFEFVFRRPLSMRAREVLQQIGLILLILLMVFAFYNDFMRFNLFQMFFGWFSGG